MSATVMPCFIDSNGNPRPEGAIIGRLLAGYGDLELEMCTCISQLPNGDIDSAVKKIFGKRGAERRIEMAEEVLIPAYTAIGMGAEISGTLSDMHWCREIRNQFAHCHFVSWGPFGIRFVDLENVAKLTGRIRKLAHSSADISLSTLKSQEAYFNYVQTCFQILAHAFSCSVAKAPNRGRSMPAKMARPPKHS